MIEVTVNGEPQLLDTESTVTDLVTALIASAKGVAVAIDREVIPRSAWATTAFQPGQIVEIVTAAAGG